MERKKIKLKEKIERKGKEKRSLLFN